MPALAVASDSSLSVKFENDGLASSDDGHFTSGFELNWTFTPQEASGCNALRQRCPIVLSAKRIRRLIV
ncbi:lipid A-modifier LpxR family protein [Halomonas sp. 3D7M]